MAMPVIGDLVKDAKNEYIIRGMAHKNTHSQHASDYYVECISGPNKGKIRWILAPIVMAFWEK